MRAPWECQNCGEEIGYVGRFIQWMRIPLHRCAPICKICKGQGLMGWYKPMGQPPTMVFVPQFCQCERGQSLARINAPDAKRTIVSSIPDFDF